MFLPICSFLFIFNADIRYNKFNEDRTDSLAIAYKLQNGNYITTLY